MAKTERYFVSPIPRYLAKAIPKIRTIRDRTTWLGWSNAIGKKRMKSETISKFGMTPKYAS